LGRIDLGPDIKKTESREERGREDRDEK